VRTDDEGRRNGAGSGTRLRKCCWSRAGDSESALAGESCDPASKNERRVLVATPSSREAACYRRRMPTPPKLTPDEVVEQETEQVVEQTVEIEEVVADALDLLDQVRYSLKMLEDRLSSLAEARKRARDA
jgi:hypothetical protein